MKMNGMATAFCFSLFCLAQTPSSNPIRAFFEELPASRQSGMPSNDELLRVTDLIPNAHVDAVKEALPAIFRAFGDKDDDVKKYAGLVLFAIARRSDGAALLHDHLPAIVSALYSSTDLGVQIGTLGIIQAFNPRPPKDAAPMLLQYLRSGRAPEYVKSSLVGVLVWLAPAAPEVVEAVSAVMTQKLKPQFRIDILNALGAQ